MAASARLSSSYLSLITVAPTTLTVNQTAFNTLSTESTVVVQCNLSQFCDNKTSYYWMFVSVEVAVEGSTKSEQDVQAWVSDLFRPKCDLGDLMQSSSTTLATYSNNMSDGITTGTASTSTLCQKNPTVTLQDINVDCEDKKDFKKTNCTVLIQLSQPTDTCSMRQLLRDRSTDSSLHAELMGEVERVGKNLCVDENMLPPGDGFVYCNSSLPSSEVCQSEKPVSVTCSYKKKSFTPRVLNKAQAQPCDNNTQNQCSCSRFCSDSGAFYAFSLNISSLDVTFDDVKNTITQLDCPCNSTILPSLCNVSSHYQGVHIQCHGDGTRLYSCLVALQLSQLLDLCSVSEALAALFQSSTFITYDGILTRLALCGSAGDSAYSLLNSNFTWVSANISADQMCTLSQFSLTTQFTCGKGQVLSVLLNESCTVGRFKIGTSPSQTPRIPPSPGTISPAQMSLENATSPKITANSVNIQSNSTVTTLNSVVTPVGPIATTATPSSSVVAPINGTFIKPNATASSFNATVTLSNTVTPFNTTLTTVDPIVTPFNVTANSSSSVVASISSTGVEPNATASSPSTTVTLSSTVTPYSPVVAPFNTTANLSSSVVASINSTGVEPNATASSPSTTVTLSSTVTSLQTTDAPANITDTPLDSTTSLSSAQTNFSTPYNTTVMQINETVSPHTIQHNTTGLQQISTHANVTQANTTVSTVLSADSSSLLSTLFNTTTTTQNTVHLSTTTPLYNITQLSTADTTQFSTKVSENTTHFGATDFSQNISHSSATARDLNTTLPNTTAPSANITQYNTAVPLNATTFSTAKPSWSSTQLQTATNATASVNITYPNTTSASLYTTHHQNVTASVNTIYPNNTNSPLYATASLQNTNATASGSVTHASSISTNTSSPLYTTTSFNNMTESAASHVRNATASVDVTYTNTSSPPLNTTEHNSAHLNTTSQPFYTTASYHSATESNATLHVTNATSSVSATHPNAATSNTTSSTLYTAVSFGNVTESIANPNATSASASVHVTHPNNATVNVTSPQFYTVENTTSSLIYTTGHHNATVNTTHPNTQSSPLCTSASNTTLNVTFSTASMNITQPNATRPQLDTTQNHTSPPLYATMNTTQPNTTINQLNSTVFNVISTTQTAEENTTQFNTSAFVLNVTTPNTRDYIHNATQDNTTVHPLNTTEFNTTLNPLNSTEINTTEPQNATQHNKTDSFGTIQFNNTTSVPPTTWTNTTEMVNFTTDVSLEQNTTASALNTTQFDIRNMIQNTTLDNAYINNITSDTITTVNMTNPIDKGGSATPNTTSSPSISLAILASSTTDTANNTTDSISEAQPSLTTSNKVLTTLGTTMATSTEATTRSTTAIMVATAGPPSTTSSGAPVPPQPAVQTTTTTTTTKTETTTTDSPEESASQLLNQTLNQDMSTLNASQLEQLVNGVENLLSGPNISLDLGQKVLSLIDRLLSSSTDAVASSSNRLIKAVGTLGLRLFIRDKTESITMASLALMVTKIDGTNFMGTSFSITDPVSLQVNSRRRRSASSHLGSISLPASLTENLSLVEQQQASRVQFTFFSKSTLFQEKTHVPGKNLTLNSHILGTSVANLSIKGLRENVVFTLRNKAPVIGNLTCVFWDFEKNHGSGGWNNSGCAVMNTSTENETMCSCNHLTSFAVLMDLSRDVITDPVQATILTFITYIGCGISAIFLAVTLLSYLAFEKIRRDIPSKILINLCFALLLLNMVFLLDSWLALYTDAVGLCISTAFFLHYFLLASFTWMGLEALHLYLAIVKVFNNCMSRYILKFALAGWGVPLLVVVIVIAVDKNNYGLITYAKYTDGTTDDFCWLKNNTAFYVAVVAYFCVIFVFNMIMFVVVMVQLRRIKRQNPHNNQYRSGLQDLRSIAGLTILLGLTWGFAFFAWGVVSLAFMYLFTIFNSLQGFFIFVFHCAIKETVRRQWRTYLCCGKFRLAENSEWSRTATRNATKKTSLATANSSHGSRTQSASRSSSLSTNSIPQSNNNSSAEDSVSTSMEGSSDDVVLNEINSQHRALHRTD